jgi:hypothetical protein
MQTSQAEALDEAMFGMHADLVTGFRRKWKAGSSSDHQRLARPC